MPTNINSKEEYLSSLVMDGLGGRVAGAYGLFYRRTDEEIKAVAATKKSGEALYMKVIVCFRHFKCIYRKWRKGRDYSWHLQHLLREFGWGPLAEHR